MTTYTEIDTKTLPLFLGPVVTPEGDVELPDINIDPTQDNITCPVCHLLAETNFDCYMLHKACAESLKS